jgi:hypothetical protein
MRVPLFFAEFPHREKTVDRHYYLVFQRWIDKTCWSNYDELITEDKMKTAILYAISGCDSSRDNKSKRKFKESSTQLVNMHQNT